ncbi:MAG: hypothetical protein CVV02_17600 [Firmicutes bacterium HGW-Firmicutes-7]|nr:MAG: hypothetical protein CVV02_17600 [Firmicutes bacterium HGW-Firmicutes-7]
MKMKNISSLIIMLTLLSSCLYDYQDDSVKNKAELETMIAETQPSSIEILKDEIELPTLIEDKGKTDVFALKLLYKSEAIKHSSGLLLAFELYSTNGEIVEQINVFDLEKDSVLESLVVKDSKGMITESYGFYIDDYNFDGYEDIRLQGSGGSGANTTFSYWLWSNELETFVFCDEYDGLTQEFFDYKNRFIISANSCCAGASYIEEVFTVDEDYKLSLYRTLSREWNEKTNEFYYKIFSYEVNRRQLLYEISDNPEDENDDVKLELFWGKIVWYLEEFD